MQAVGGEHLDGDDEEDEVLCEGLWPAELSYLRRSCRQPSFDPIEKLNGLGREEYFRMRFNDSHSPCPVRLLRIRPEEIMFLDLERRGGLGVWRAA